MNETLQTFLILATVIITGIVVWVGYYMVQTLKKAQEVLIEVKETTDSLSVVKGALRTGAMGLGSYVLAKLINGGDTHGKK